MSGDGARRRQRGLVSLAAGNTRSARRICPHDATLDSVGLGATGVRCMASNPPKHAPTVGFRLTINKRVSLFAALTRDNAQEKKMGEVPGFRETRP